MGIRKVTDEMVVIAKIETLIRECAATRVMCSEIGIKVTRIHEQLVCPANPLPSVQESSRTPRRSWDNLVNDSHQSSLDQRLSAVEHTLRINTANPAHLAQRVNNVEIDVSANAAAHRRLEARVPHDWKEQWGSIEKQVKELAQRFNDYLNDPEVQGLCTSVRRLLHWSSNHRDALAALTVRVARLEDPPIIHKTKRPK